MRGLVFIRAAITRAIFCIDWRDFLIQSEIFDIP